MAEALDTYYQAASIGRLVTLGAYTHRKGIDRETTSPSNQTYSRNRHQREVRCEFQEAIQLLSRNQIQTLLRELKAERRVEVRGHQGPGDGFPAQNPIRLNHDLIQRFKILFINRLYGMIWLTSRIVNPSECRRLKRHVKSSTNRQPDSRICQPYDGLRKGRFYEDKRSTESSDYHPILGCEIIRSKASAAPYGNAGDKRNSTMVPQFRRNHISVKACPARFSLGTIAEH